MSQVYVGLGTKGYSRQTDNTFPARLRISDWSIGHAKSVEKYSY